MRSSRAAAALGLLGLVAFAASLSGQQAADPMRRAFELERRGNYGDAVAAYREVLERNRAMLPPSSASSAR